MLENILLLLGLSDDSNKEDLINLLIRNAKSYAVRYCGIAEYDSSLDSAVMKMVVEDYNKLGSEGLASKSFSGVSESYKDGYSESVLAELKMYSRGSVKFY